MTHWCRLWDDMPNDPKWRVVAKRSGRPVSEVLAVFVHMMTNAANADERGRLQNWSDEDVSIAIDAEVEHVSVIRDAMQGKTLDGDRLAGWDKRQPKREDGSADRARDWRERKKEEKEEAERMRTHANAEKHRADQSREDRGSFPGSSTEPKPLPVRSERAGEKEPRSAIRKGYPEDFEAFWDGYPTDPNMSKKEAFDVWKRLPGEERRAATESLPAFRRYCQSKPDYRPVHACRYLAKRRSEGFLEAAAIGGAKPASADTVYVRSDTPLWDACKTAYRRLKGRDPPIDKDGGWHFAKELVPDQSGVAA